MKPQNTIQIQIIWYSTNIQKPIATKLKAETLRNIVNLIDKLFLNNINPKQYRACKNIQNCQQSKSIECFLVILEMRMQYGNKYNCNHGYQVR
jgi:hypothetical protein